MQLHRDREEFEAEGVELAVIGQGSTEQAASFMRAQKVELPLLTDPERVSYEAVGAKVATFGELLGPRQMAKGLSATLRGRVRQGRTIGHPAQLGGVVIVATNGTIPYAHLSEEASDVPSNNEVLSAARRAARRRA